jgi:hypothetical protein
LIAFLTPRIRTVPSAVAITRAAAGAVAFVPIHSVAREAPGAARRDRGLRRGGGQRGGPGRPRIEGGIRRARLDPLEGFSAGR